MRDGLAIFALAFCHNCIERHTLSKYKRAVVFRFFGIQQLFLRLRLKEYVTRKQIPEFYHFAE